MTNTELKYNGRWTKELELHAYNRIKSIHKNGYKLRDSIKMFAEEIGVPNTTMNAKWYGVGGYKYALRDMNTEEDVTDFEKCENVETEQSETSYNSVNTGTLNILLNEIKSLAESNQQMHKDMGKLWRGFEELKETNQTLQEMLVTDIGEIRNELDTLKVDVRERYQEKIDLMERKIEIKNKKLREKEMEVQKVKTTYADLVFNSGTYNSVLTDRENTKFKMDRNGNLTRVN